MIYSNNKKFMFYHVPKTAGTSMHLIIKRHCVNNGRIPGVRVHASVKNTWDIYNGSKYFSFAFVRNPYERLYSLYKFTKRRGRFNLTLKQFINNLNDFPDQFGSSQYSLLNYKGNIPLSFIGKYENIKKDFNFVAEKIGINERYINLSFKHKLNEGSTTYREVFNNELKAIIDEKHHDDFINFNYKKEL
tara:strand:+ start:84 stop:650 length:567 start_codon:yes stop_codon:yes gene_type:complete